MTRKKSHKTTSVSLGHILIGAAIVLAIIGATRLGAWDRSKKNDISQLDARTEASLLLNVKTAADTPEQLVHYPGMDVSFNKEMHLPNWVAWELTANEADGTEPRSGSFYNDPEVAGCPETYDYSYSGYDRGHMAPAGDMKWSEEAMKASFSLANICPQAKSLNTGAWKRLEEKCRTWARADSSIIVICGPILNDPIREYIGDTRVAVPKRFFKVILAPYANPARGIGFIMPNGRPEGGMQACAVSIDEVERVTGHDFFSALPDSIETEIESQCDFPFWSRIKPKHNRK